MEFDFMFSKSNRNILRQIKSTLFLEYMIKCCVGSVSQMYEHKKQTGHNYIFEPTLKGIK